MSGQERPDLWLFASEKEIAPESFLFDSITYNHLGEAGPLVRLPRRQEQNDPGEDSETSQVSKQPHGTALP